MKIENGVQIPEQKTGGRKGKSIYPFQNMLIGQSVFYPGMKYHSAPMKAAIIYAKRLGFKFSGRTVDGGLRIWRVE